VNKELPGGVYGYAMMYVCVHHDHARVTDAVELSRARTRVARGGWQGGQAQYVPVPFADFNCLKVENKAKAAEYLMDLVLLSDVLPTGYNAAMQAHVSLGKTIYIAGAGTVSAR
jgi:threonine dehydrogenase-like Zn-dependent dehydrogenase